MSKLSIEEIQNILVQNKIEAPKIKCIITDLEKVAAELKEERENNKLPKSKWEHLVILNDLNNVLPENIKEQISAYVVQQQDGEDSVTILSKISDAAQNQNQTSKRRKTLLTNLSDAFLRLKTKFLKEKNLKIKTKEPVQILVVKNNSL